jgi:DNA-binding Lrp family transcriptional regulator
MAAPAAARKQHLASCAKERRMSLQDEVVSAIEDDGPISSEKIQEATGWPRKRVENAIYRALRKGLIRTAGFEPRTPGKGGQATALYEMTPKKEPAFCPSKCINSVWQLGSRA